LSMSQRIIINYVDDLSGESVESHELITLEWRWLGTHYTVETTQANLDRIISGDIPFADVLDKATRTNIRRHRGEAKGGTGAAHTVAEIRQWARAHGYEVNNRGRVSAAVTAAYLNSG
jgi:Lsr2